MFNAEQSTIDLERNGTWTEYEGSKFLIAHVNNPDFQRAFTRLQLPHKRKVDKGTLDAKISLDIQAKALAIGVVLDWKDVTNNAGENVPYSRDAAENVIRRNGEFREFISEFAMDVGNFREEIVVEAGKSSGSESPGT
jgi:hypothetical protein